MKAIRDWTSDLLTSISSWFSLSSINLLLSIPARDLLYRYIGDLIIINLLATPRGRLMRN